MHHQAKCANCSSCCVSDGVGLMFCDIGLISRTVSGSTNFDGRVSICLSRSLSLTGVACSGGNRYRGTLARNEKKYTTVCVYVCQSPSAPKLKMCGSFGFLGETQLP